ncbi:MAG: hypothetical protein IBX57_00330 [Gammaproteobacteria bacterium]|nr:hypothetical protein [Gammaproteobacteria bacterium]
MDQENKLVSAEVKESATEQPVVEKVVLEQDPVEVTGSNEDLTVAQIREAILNIPNVDIDELDKVVENYPKIEATKGEEGKVWVASYFEGIKALLQGSSLSEAVNRSNSVWRQKVEHEGAKLGISKPVYKDIESGEISGERALDLVARSTDLGTTVTVPLWHTGIWITLRTPTEQDMINLDARISGEKIALGRYTSGMIFSNTSVYTASYAINFVLERVVDSSIKNLTVDNLKKIIKITDIPTLLWGMAYAVHPNGYDYARACSSNPGKCQHVVRGKINLGKLFWTDTDSLTPWQRKHMSDRTGKFTSDDLLKYEKEHRRGSDRVFYLTGGYIKGKRIGIKLKVPNIKEYERAGFRWVDDIVNTATEAVRADSKTTDLDELIFNNAKTTILRQYAHWVSEFLVYTEGNEDSHVTIKDKETMESILSSISSNDAYYERFTDEIRKYIEDSTMALIAIPKYPCPVCGGEQHTDVGGELGGKSHPHLLPIDVLHTFFILLDQHTFKVLVSRQTSL